MLDNIAVEVQWYGCCKSDDCRCIVDGVIYPTSIWYHEPCGYCHDDPCWCNGFCERVSAQTYKWRVIRSNIQDENARIAYRNAVSKLH